MLIIYPTCKFKLEMKNYQDGAPENLFLYWLDSEAYDWLINGDIKFKFHGIDYEAGFEYPNHGSGRWDLTMRYGIELFSDTDYTLAICKFGSAVTIPTPPPKWFLDRHAEDGKPWIGVVDSIVFYEEAYPYLSGMRGRLSNMK